MSCSIKSSESRRRAESGKVVNFFKRIFRKPEAVEPQIWLGDCEHCHASFRYDLLHSGFGDMSYAYCERCGTAALLSYWNPNCPKTAARMPSATRNLCRDGTVSDAMPVWGTGQSWRVAPLPSL